MILEINLKNILEVILKVKLINQTNLDNLNQLLLNIMKKKNILKT